jgi:hypothetical protein
VGDLQVPSASAGRKVRLTCSLGKLRDLQAEYQCALHGFSYLEEGDELRVEESVPVRTERAGDMVVKIDRHSIR